MTFLENHVIKEKGVKVNYSCDWCPKKDFKTYSDYAQHAWAVHRRDVILPGSIWDKGKDVRIQTLPAQPEQQLRCLDDDPGTSRKWDISILQSHSHSDWVNIGYYRIKACGITGKGMTGIQVVLSEVWLKKGMILTGGLRSRLGGTPMVYVEWPDQGVIPVEVYRTLVRWIVARLREGKEVSVGCHGGHGRTGTVIAGVLSVLENLDGKVAISEVRKRYCSKAIETSEQEKLVWKAR